MRSSSQISSLFLIFSAFALFLSTCKTLHSSKPWYLEPKPVQIDSEPEGVTIEINGKIIGRTPLETKIIRGPYLKDCDICNWGENLEIWAYPFSSEQCIQWRVIPFYEQTPEKIFFNMYSCPQMILSEKIEVLSEPAGARIEINGIYIGETPLTTTIFRHWKEPLKIVAYPSGAGLCPQEKYIPAYQRTPYKIFFDLRVCVPFAPQTVSEIKRTSP